MKKFSNILFVAIIGLVFSCVFAPTKAQIQFSFQGKVTDQSGRRITFVVPASTSLLPRNEFPLNNVPSSKEYSNHPLYKIATYDLFNLPKLDVPENHLVVPPTHLLPSSFNDPVPAKETKHGILYIQPLPSLEVNRERVNSEQLGNARNPTHFFVKPNFDRNYLQPVMNALGLSNQQLMAEDLSRFKVYQAVPDHIF